MGKIKDELKKRAEKTCILLDTKASHFKTVDRLIRQMIKIAHSTNMSVKMNFDGIWLVAEPNSAFLTMMGDYALALEEEWQEM